MINFLKFPKQIVQWKSLEIKLNYIKYLYLKFLNTSLKIIRNNFNINKLTNLIV